MQRIQFSVVMAILVLVLTGCGDSGSSPTPTAPPPPPLPPSASIQVTGSGAIKIHPSLDRRFLAAIEFPITIIENGGGSAIWNFFRVSYFRNGAQVERNERGSDEIRMAGYRDIAARSTTRVDVITRVNTQDFDNVQILLGFADARSGQAIQVMLDFADFTGVVIDLTPALIPDGVSFSVEASGK